MSDKKPKQRDRIQFYLKFVALVVILVVLFMRLQST